MCRFYGWTLEQVQSLDVDTFDQMWMSITVLEAREMLHQMTIGDYPNLKQNARESLHKQLSREAYPSSLRPVKQVSNSELARILGG